MPASRRYLSRKDSCGTNIKIFNYEISFEGSGDETRDLRLFIDDYFTTAFTAASPSTATATIPAGTAIVALSDAIV